MLLTVGQAVKNAVMHPVPLPIIAGLLYAQTGWGLHPVVDRPLKLLGDAFGPVALVLVGVTLAQAAIGAHLKGALVISLLKTVLHPALMGAAGWLPGCAACRWRSAWRQPLAHPTARLSPCLLPAGSAGGRAGGSCGPARTPTVGLQAVAAPVRRARAGAA
jgi:predicted permease